MTKPARSEEPQEQGRVRLDVWLDVSCLFPTRSAAQQAIKGGKVELNGHSAKPHRELAIGDVIEITRLLGRRQRVIVKGLTDRHIAKAEARLLYEDTTPPPSPQEQAMLDLMRLAGPKRRSVGTSDRRERQHIRKVKQGGPIE